jgi:hypothetical protein
MSLVFRPSYRINKPRKIESVLKKQKNQGFEQRWRSVTMMDHRTQPDYELDKNSAETSWGPHFIGYCEPEVEDHAGLY